MKAFLIIVAAIFILCIGMGISSFSFLQSHKNARTVASSYDQGVNYFSFVGNKRFISPVYYPDLQKTSDWNLDKGTIPLGPDKAAHLSQKKLKELSLNPSDWIIESVTLTKFRPELPYFYLVRYIRNVDSRDEIKIVVFLDGTVVTPGKTE